MTNNDIQDIENRIEHMHVDSRTVLAQFVDQADRYMKAVYGPDIYYQAPEVEPNILIRWIRSIAALDPEHAEEHMTQIESMAMEYKET